MAQFMTDVSDLLGQLQSSIDSIHRSMHQLSDTSFHDAEVTRLEEACEKRIAELRGHHEGLKKEIMGRRIRKDAEIAEMRRKEEREILERRMREDEERKKRVDREEQQREREVMEEHEKVEKEREESEKQAVNSVEEEIEKLEGEIMNKWEEGRQRVKELDEKRKEINKKIDEMLSLPAEFPKLQSRRRATTGSQRSISKRTAQMQQQSLRRGSMLDRLWNGERYVCERYFQGPSRPDSMLSRLWNGHRYPAHQHFGALNDPMLNRLWSGETYEACERDPMIARLWSGERYGQNKRSRMDPMLRRLWSNTRYPSSSKYDPMMERLWSNTAYSSPSEYDPMMERLWSNVTYPEEHTSFKHDPMITRLWSNARYEQEQPTSFKHDPMMKRLWSYARYGQVEYGPVKNDPMLSRLWNGERYNGDKILSHQDDPMLCRLWNGKSYSKVRTISHKDDPMLAGLWNREKHSQDRKLSHKDDPMLVRLRNGERYAESKRQNEIQDPMMERLWAPRRYREDLMVSRLWATVRYRGDSMLDRLWNGDRYSEETEEHDILVRDPNSYRAPISKPFILENALQHDIKHANTQVSEIQDSDEYYDEEEDIVTSSQRHSGAFTTFINSIRTDIPIVDNFLRNQEYADIPIEDDFDEFVQNPIPDNAPEEHHVHFEDLAPSESSRYDTEEDGEEVFRFRNEPAGLRIQTQLSPFEAQFPSGVDSSPATPSDTEFHAFQELHHESNISWSPPREELHLDRVVKLEESNPFVGRTGTYTSYMPAQSDTRDESVSEQERPGSKGGVGNHFNNVPQNPRLSGDANTLGVGDLTEVQDTVRLQGKAALLGRLSKMAGGLYYGGSGEERGRLLVEDGGV